MANTSPGSRGSFALSYQVSPIILNGGIAKNLPGGIMPIINLTQPGIYEAGLLSPAGQASLDEFFAHYTPMAGATLIDNQIGQYPFANQSVAANAIVTQPLRISMLVSMPARGPGGWSAKTQLMSSLRQSLAQHNNLAGTYTVATPSYTYENCIMTGFRDVSGGDSKQPQNTWQMDFMQPLLTLEAAQAAMNVQMEKISKQLPIPGDPPKATGVGSVVPPVGTGLIPSARPLVGANK